jgi:hypothetical protein
MNDYESAMDTLRWFLGFDDFFEKLWGALDNTKDETLKSLSEWPRLKSSVDGFREKVINKMNDYESDMDTLRESQIEICNILKGFLGFGAAFTKLWGVLDKTNDGELRHNSDVRKIKRRVDGFLKEVIVQLKKNMIPIDGLDGGSSDTGTPGSSGPDTPGSSGLDTSGSSGPDTPGSSDHDQNRPRTQNRGRRYSGLPNTVTDKLINAITDHIFSLYTNN